MRNQSAITLAVWAVLAATAPPAMAADAPAGTQVENGKISLHIASQPIGDSLNDFGRQSGLHVVLFSELADGLIAPALRGSFTPTEALQRLLANSGLRFKYLDQKTIAVLGENVTQFRSTQDTSSTTGLHLAQVQETPPAAEQAMTNRASVAAAVSGDSPGRTHIEEIVVTAQKRKQRLQDVPLSVAVVSAEDIDRRGLVSGEDYLRGIPGANQVADAFGGGAIVIRGMETSPINQNFSSGPTTATYFGETPTTNSAGLSGNMNVDLKLVDIERVEVLRGPQGTAFGNSSLGGAVRTIPVAPDLERFEGKVSAGYSGTSGTGGSNNMIQAVGSLPLVAGKLAIRASAFRFDDSGFYRNVAGSDPAFRAAAATPFGAEAFAVNQKEVGASEYTGGRIAASFQATEDLNFTLLYLKQKTQVDGALISGTGGFDMSSTSAYDQAVLQVAPEHSVRGQSGAVADTDIDLANAVMEWNIGWGSVVATVSHIDSNTTNATPYTWCCAGLPISALAPSEHREDVGELRLTTQLDGAWQFLAGVYTERLKDEYSSNYVWHGDPATYAGVR
ncbi:TonB-dependent receptor, partial [Steroidobacter sp.]|uniref:TonB-dependent receptor n=1 Tax=Steroidobacter sp. TaxID=1978227 RepID=UPI001A43E9D1